MTTKINNNGLSPYRYVESSAADMLATSREKMISLLVEARLLQSEQVRSQLLPHLKTSNEDQITSAISLLSEVFGNEGHLPIALRHLVACYLSDEEIGPLSLFVNMPRFINLSDQNTFRKYASEEFSKTRGSDLLLGAEIVNQIYECARGSISEARYGSTFCMYPEIMAYAIQLAKNETVLEIAGAKGENSAVLAFSGAERIYVNDICKNEIEEFEKIKKSLPQDLGQKLESVHGNCLDLLKLKPELSKKVGLILCRNLIHFFNSKLQAEFFALLKKILKPGGRGIFTVNSIYVTPSYKKIFESHPDITSFCQTYGTINDYTQGTQPIAIFYDEVSPFPDEDVSTDFVTRYLYTKENGSAWKVDNDEFNQLDKELHPTIQKALSPYKAIMRRISEGSVRVIMTSIRMYNTKTLPELFKQHGFQVECTFITSHNGHLVHKQNPFDLQVKETPYEDRPQQIGVIVRYPGNE